MKAWKPMTEKAELLRHMGSVGQLGGLKRYRFAEGRADGMEAVDVNTGSGLEFTVLPGRCMDLAFARYRGVPLSYLSKAELSAAPYAEREGMEWLRSFYAGLLTTCGFDNVGGPFTAERRIFGMQHHGLHGRLANLPASEVCANGDWTESGYAMRVSGKVRQSAVHGENLVLHRTVTAALGEKLLHLHDRIENEGHMEEPLMLLYHMNFGYPLLSDQSRLLTASNQIQGADALARSELDQWGQFHPPMHQRDERCYFHMLQADSQGKTTIALVNDALELGVALTFDVRQLPCLTEWKMLSEGEYVLGLEPGNTYPVGLPAAKNRGMLEYLEPGGVKEVSLDLEVLDGPEEIAAAEARIHALEARP